VVNSTANHTVSTEGSPVDKSQKDSLLPQTSKTQLEIAPPISEQPLRVSALGDEKNNFSKPHAKLQNDTKLISVENIPLPVLVIVTDPVELLNATGKDVPIPVDTVIKIKNRTSHGTLTMEIDGAMFVGNEERLAKKVRLH